MHRIFIDKCSGKNTDRPELKKMLDYLGGGNFLVVSEYVRLARSSADMLDLWTNFKQKVLKLSA